jgi:hypothetical protein
MPQILYDEGFAARVLPAAFNDEVRTTLLDKRLQEQLLKIDGAANREQVCLAGCVAASACRASWLDQYWCHMCEHAGYLQLFCHCWAGLLICWGDAAESQA